MKNSKQKNILDIPSESFFELCQNQFQEKKLFIFEKENTAPETITGKELVQKTVPLGNMLQQTIEPQERVLIILPQSLEYIYSLFACFYANVIAVPIPVTDFSNPEQVMEKVSAILKDSQATSIITDGNFQEFLKTKRDFDSIFILNAFGVEQAETGNSQPRAQLPDDTSILLYTSGSTSTPKGVMISHQGLKERAWASVIQWNINTDSCIVSWLPQYHSFSQDLNIFAPILKGATSILQTPNSFIKKPQGWLFAIDRYKATHTGAPNFAYDYCCSSIKNETLKGISLKSLQIILSGGEPIRRQSCENFYNKLKDFGLQKNIFSPIYGLSEMGTVVTSAFGKPMQVLTLDISSLEKGEVKISENRDKGKSITSCGKIRPGTEVQIVNPQNFKPCATDEVGEIWIKSPAIGKGYFNREKETKDTFNGILNNTENGGFLRTGDLGFIKNQEVYIVGREKEVIIIHGKNYHPVDIEWTIKNKLTNLDLPIAIFSCEIEQEERIIVVQEIETGKGELEYKNIAYKILSLISLTYQVETYDVVLVQKGTIPRTGSGKIRRKACGNNYINHQLKTLYQFRHQNPVTQAKAEEEPSTVAPDILETLKKEVLTSELNITSERISEAKSFNELGLNSIQYIKIAKRIEEIFNIEFNPVMLFEHKDLTTLAQYLANQTKHQTPSATQALSIDKEDVGDGSNENESEIAIIGISCHFPGGATDQHTFWRNLMQQKDCITQMSDRPSIIADYQKFKADSENSLPQWAGFIKNVDTFDAPFFHISPLEAESMDPQQRKILELTWSVIEDSGYNPRELSDTNVGMFIGVHTNDYSELVSRQPGLMETYGAFLDSGLHTSMIANRVSRWLDFHGPSEVINTACSSSLVSVHHAAEAITKKKCNMAVAGGINLILASRVSCASNKGGMLAKDGRCKTFDQSADGFVRAEGYGAVLLKSLKQAKADGDIIYGVIKGAAINHDGHSNSLRAPNLTAQKELIKNAYKKAKIPATGIGYIEAHGTGTELGDPIEIQALKEAFQEMGAYGDEAYCALGSIKTNIGHCESAAGIAGLIKILLSLKHQTIPGILHFKQINPYISLENTPFYIADKHYDWKRKKDTNGREMPLQAGISSFGFGGSNAHLIIEEYISEKKERLPIEIDTKNPAIVVLSAKDSKRLQEQAKQLLEFLQKQPKTELADIAYTLQIGREVMEERLGLITKSVGELKEKLQAYIEGKENIEGLYRGQLMHNKDALAELIEDEDIAKAISAWVEKKKFGKLLDLWVKGYAFDWKKLYRNIKPSRISLPTYPFAQERYWIADTNVQEKTNEYKPAQLHPLVHTNTSNFAEQCFSSVFTGEEFFLKDHTIQMEGLSKQKVLPGVAYLEMARAAIEQAMPDQPEPTTLVLQNVVWVQPIVVTGNSSVAISLFPNDSERGDKQEIEFEIYTQDKEQQLVHCQGQAVYNKPEPSRLNINKLKGQMVQGELETSRLYSAFAKMGLHYGPSHKGIDSVYLGEKQLLALLRLPVRLEAGQKDYLLHPSIMDSALQTSICLMEDFEQLNGKSPMPFSLETIHILSPITKEMYAWVRYSQGSKPEDAVSKFDVDLCDAQGNICVQMSGFSTRFPERETTINNKKTVHLEKTVGNSQCFVPIWNPLFPEDHKNTVLPETAKVLLLGGNHEQLNWLQKSYPQAQLQPLPSGTTINNIQATLKKCTFDHLLWVAPDLTKDDRRTDAENIGIIEKQEQGVLTVFRIIKALLQLGYAEKELQCTLITRNTQKVKKDDVVHPAHAGIFGLIGSLAKEYLHWNIRLLDLESLETVTAQECLSLSYDKEGNGKAYRQGEWFSQELAQVDALPQSDPIYKQKGVYVVIGGAGGVGEVWSRFMIENYQANIIWIGRQEHNASIEDKIKKISQLGNPPQYISADATKLEDLEQALGKIQEKYPTIHGVVHSAIVLQDQSITHMEEAKFRASLSAKVDISVNMNRVFGGQDLDFMLFFSSLISFSKSAGQSNYAAGSTFKDSYALNLQQEHAYPVKIINWGYWGMTGIVTDESYKKRMAQQGIGSIEPQEGMAALQTQVGSDIGQLVYHKTLNAQAVANLNVTEAEKHYPKTLTLDLSQVQKATNNRNLPEHTQTLEAGKLPVEMETLATEILASSLTSLGLFSQGAVRISDLSLEKQPALFYERWLGYSINFLQQQKLLKTDFTFNHKTTKLGELWEEWENKKTGWIADPNLKAHTILLGECLKALPKILSGKQPATEVMFPNSSMQLVEGIYKKNTTADYYNEVLAETLKTCIQQQADKGNKFRILEIGAGTGGTTAKLLPLLQEFSDVVEEYCYTDLSKAFLLHAEENYKPQFPALTTSIFDVSQPLSMQSIATDHYDAIIATNVLHATPNIRRTMRNAKAALKNQGIILLNEISSWSLFTHLTFGLLEGWWLYEDTALRLPGSPGVTPSKWREILAEEGFEPVLFPAENLHQFGQQIIVASSNGVVRQSIHIEPPVKLEAETPIETIKPEVDEEKALAEPTGSLREMSIPYFQKLVAETLRMNPSQIKPYQQFSEYGLDSILVVQLTNKLRKEFPDITSTLFFEVQTLDGLVDYFMENKKEALMATLPISTDLAIPKETTVTLNNFTTQGQKTPNKQKTTQIQRISRRRTIQVESKTQDKPHIFDVAVIGLSGRYPQSNNLREFWLNLSKGINCITEIPKVRWDWEEYYDPEKGKPGKMYTKWGGFIDNIDKFDPLFFKISPKDAKQMDPQERLFLESCYHAIEDAGYTPENLGNIDKIGVFAGVMNSRYTPQPFHYSIANRVSYLFNFQGPSMAVDTACSSSLTAMHLALESIYSGLSDCAIAGGVNLIIDSEHYLGLTEMTMLSSGNQCKAFGDRADGFVDAEGVGAIILKPLKQAEKDGDNIYGVLKGSAVNAGGKTNGYTVPNPKAQSAVVAKALERSGIGAEQISYIEAHGTGTALGDPIEIASLSRTFKEAGKKNQFCSIGSVKSNIGHCESAAGIAGITKVLLQFKHNQIVPSLHSQVANPEIDFGQTPFKVQKSLEEWQRPIKIENGITREIPRMAGISSFGAGGSNAHIILQEYTPTKETNQTEASTNQGGKVFIPLSARTLDQLKQKAIDLLDYIQTEEQDHQAQKQTTQPLKPVELESIAYTLQVGRVAMDERLGLMVNTVGQLAEKLKAYINGQDDIEDAYQGQVKHHRETLSIFSTDKDLQQAIENWIASKKFTKLYDLWAKGLDFDWNKLYTGAKPRRISLPTYPFARESYWKNLEDKKPQGQKTTRTAVLHPMLHTNTSDFHQHSYTTMFSGTEFFLTNINGQKNLPTEAYLEMARVAVEKAMPSEQEAFGLTLHNIEWGQPFIFNENKSINIALFEKEGNTAGYEIYSFDNDEETIHCQGQATYTPQLNPETLNIGQLKKKQGHGLNQIMTEIQLPATLENSLSEYILHPSILESAWQAASGIINDSQPNHEQLATPFALETLSIQSPCRKEMFASVGYSESSLPGGATVKLDITLCDQYGNVCVQMQGLTYQREVLNQIEQEFEHNLSSITHHAPTQVKLAPAQILFNEHQHETIEQVGLKVPISIKVAEPEELTINKIEDASASRSLVTLSDIDD